MVNISYYCCTT